MTMISRDVNGLRNSDSNRVALADVSAPLRIFVVGLPYVIFYKTLNP